MIVERDRKVFIAWLHPLTFFIHQGSGASRTPDVGRRPRKISHFEGGISRKAYCTIPFHARSSIVTGEPRVAMRALRAYHWNARRDQDALERVKEELEAKANSGAGTPKAATKHGVAQRSHRVVSAIPKTLLGIARSPVE